MYVYSESKFLIYSHRGHNKYMYGSIFPQCGFSYYSKFNFGLCSDIFFSTFVSG